jgi:hypothetical protein
MSIYTVRDNLKSTIAGKEKALQEMQGNYSMWSEAERLAREAAQSYLKINIDELRRILQDVETCCAQATNASWAANPDRSGGAYTQDEMSDRGWN